MVRVQQAAQGWAWLIVYMFYMMLVSWLGSSEFGGINVIPYGWDMVVVAVSSLVFYFWGIHSGFTTKHVERAETEVQQTTQVIQITG